MALSRPIQVLRGRVSHCAQRHQRWRALNGLTPVCSFIPAVPRLVTRVRSFRYTCSEPNQCRLPKSPYTGPAVALQVKKLQPLRSGRLSQGPHGDLWRLKPCQYYDKQERFLSNHKHVPVCGSSEDRIAIELVWGDRW